MTCAFADPKEWLLEIPTTVKSQLWQQSQVYASPNSRWRAYINQICLHGFLTRVETEYALQAVVWKSFADTPAFWEYVNGTAVLLNQKRVVLIPSEAIDDSQLEVPQEWVDIPSWKADFYLAVQVTPDGDWVRFWGYTTHQELKTQAEYDSVDKTYCIDAEDFTKDLNAFWMAFQFCREEDIQAVISALPEISTTQAENMLQQLSRSGATFSRLEIPFTSWGALLDKERWRQRLYQQFPRNRQMQLSPMVNLSAWLQDIYENSWQVIETFFYSNSSSLAFNFRSNTGLNAASIKRAKAIDLGTEADAQKVIMLVALIPEAKQQLGIRVQLHPFDDEYLPLNIKLVLLSDAAEIIQEVTSRLQDNYIQLKLFAGELGESFSVQVILDDYQIIEKFII